MQSNDLSSLIRADISLSSDCLASLIALDSIESPDLDLLSDLGLLGVRDILSLIYRKKEQ